MRFCVRRLDVCPGKEKRILRKDAFSDRDVTERRILQPVEIVQTALFRYVATREAWGNRPPACGVP